MWRVLYCHVIGGRVVYACAIYRGAETGSRRRSAFISMFLVLTPAHSHQPFRFAQRISQLTTPSVLHANFFPFSFLHQRPTGTVTVCLSVCLYIPNRQPDPLPLPGPYIFLILKQFQSIQFNSIQQSSFPHLFALH